MDHLKEGFVEYTHIQYVLSRVRGGFKVTSEPTGLNGLYHKNDYIYQKCMSEKALVVSCNVGHKNCKQIILVFLAGLFSYSTTHSKRLLSSISFEDSWCQHWPI
jgi:hypothetical protein